MEVYDVALYDVDVYGSEPNYFKLGVAGSETSLPLCVVEELPTDAEDTFDEAEMADGSFNYCAKSKVRRTWEIAWDRLTGAEVTTLDGIAALKVTLNYINGYMGITSASVVVAHWTGRILIVNTSGLTTPRYRATMTLREVN